MATKSAIPRLSILIPTLLAVWLATVVMLHGPAMIAYVVMHLITTGLFAFGMWKTEQKFARTGSVAGSEASPIIAKSSETSASQEVDSAIAS